MYTFRYKVPAKHYYLNRNKCIVIIIFHQELVLVPIVVSSSEEYCIRSDGSQK